MRYRLARHSATGEVLRTVERGPEWFSEPSSWNIGSPTVAPPPFLAAAAVTGDTLWTAIRVARPDWRQAWQGIELPRSGRLELTAGQAPDRSELYRTRLEAIDLEAGRVITTAYIDGIVVHIGGDRTVAVYRTGLFGEPYLTIHECWLQGPSR